MLTFDLIAYNIKIPSLLTHYPHAGEGSNSVNVAFIVELTLVLLHTDEYATTAHIDSDPLVFSVTYPGSRKPPCQ